MIPWDKPLEGKKRKSVVMMEEKDVMQCIAH